MHNGIDRDGFRRRHIGIAPHDIEPMLSEIGVGSIDALIAETMPPSIMQREPLRLGAALSEREALDRLRAMAARNRVCVSMIGQGYYGTHLPPVIQRNILENPAWYTAYTPYQPEISQGRLEALVNFQTMVADLTALPVANASLLDEATASAEAMAMAFRLGKTQRMTFFVDADCHPQTIAVMRTRAEPLGWSLEVGDPLRALDPANVFGALLQYPGSSGEIRDFRDTIARLHAAGALAVMAADPLALTLLVPPGELGADIAVGSMQRFGVPMGYGGPHAAYIATRDEYKRALPGRIVGISIDSRGHPACRLALQTREQHIRREKATSNICTSQVLLAVIAAMYGVYHGPDGLKRIAQEVHRRACALARGLRTLGFEVETAGFFDTVTVRAGTRREAIVARACERGINLRRVGDDGIGLSCDETTEGGTIDAVLEVFAACGGDARIAAPSASAGGAESALPPALLRTSEFMQHAVFHACRSETEILRYMRRLADRDLALDRTMIPLGSCTMQLNATAEMIPVTWPEFSDLHPFAPAEQAQGYAALLDALASRLCAITGYDAISLQPNSGAQGEYAGLLAIRAYHRSRGEGHRNICLIPSSAHGTNPASAHLAGLDVVVVECDPAGNVDIADLRAKAEKHAARLAAVMITYPSTHGVFETDIGEICDTVHRHGGQVYLDGANLNAQVGLARPGDYGADVSHINLHKTFCIPHGGGGPGMGPIGVKAHLAPFLPGHPQHPDPSAPGPVAAAPFGSASILPISLAYILMMGGEGLTEATRVAILSANYVAARLQAHYPLLFRNRHNRVAHECILDMRPFRDSAGITVDDIAKRLIDCGFHAPTMSFPVPGTLMIEPTESESRAELDRFCEAMIAIRKEIASIERGRMAHDNNPLKNAPHTVADLADADWNRPYSREAGAFPLPSLRQDKYFSPVNRIDNAHGDRNLVCTCQGFEIERHAAE